MRAGSSRPLQSIPVPDSAGQPSTLRKAVAAATLVAVVGATVTATNAVSSSGSDAVELSAAALAGPGSSIAPAPALDAGSQVEAAIAEAGIAAQHRAAADVAGRAAADTAADTAVDTAAETEKLVVLKTASATTAVSAAVVSGTSPSAAKATAKSLLLARGWGSRQYRCLVTLWQRESSWNYRATNRSSGAYGLAQALPARKMASAGADWRTNPATQITWGLGYIADRYRTPCGALAHSRATGWY